MKIALITLGCSKNLVDSEVMLGIISSSKHLCVEDVSKADAVIINTCGFINDAKEESINSILEIEQLKKQDIVKYIVVVGCLAQRYSEEIAEQIPLVDLILGTADYGNILKFLEQLDSEKNSLPPKIFLSDMDNCDWLEKDRIVSTDKGVAYVKIAEGCDNNCTYCIIPKLRGRYRSRTIINIVQEAEKLANTGITEIILIAQDTTYYGKDIYGEYKLVELIKKISEISNLQRIRVLYCYPELISDELINEFATNKKLCKYIDVPIQHASDKILKLMGRKTTNAEIKAKLLMLKESVRDISIRTTFIVGFPGETEDDFNQLLQLVEFGKFDNMGAFKYSREENTPAYNLKNQVSSKISDVRYEKLMFLQQSVLNGILNKKINQIFEVIVEGVADDGIFYYGRAYFQAPEIDGVIYFTSESELVAGQYVCVKILSVDNYDLIGDVVK